MRAFLLLVLILPMAALGAEKDDGFIWIDANTRIKKPPTASSGGSAPEKAPQKKEEKDKPKK